MKCRWVRFEGTELETLCIDYIYNVAMSVNLGGNSYMNEQERLRLHKRIDEILPNSKSRTSEILNNLEKEVGLPTIPEDFDAFRVFIETHVIPYGKKVCKKLKKVSE